MVGRLREAHENYFFSAVMIIAAVHLEQILACDTKCLAVLLLWISRKQRHEAGQFTD